MEAIRRLSSLLEDGCAALDSHLRHQAARAVVGAAFLLAWAGIAAAQGTTEIRGRIVDAETGRTISGARVLVVGTSSVATARPDGGYTIAGVPAGSHSVQASALGYATKTVTGVVTIAGRTADLDVSLNTAALAIEGLTISAAAERGSVSRALDEQRTSVNVMSGVSREEIQRGPDDDAAEAVQRVSGVTVEGGRYVFVRGLGERYTTTHLNGARLPSPEPDRRVVPLDLFPAGTLEGITVSKTFTPDQSGDFAGGQVDLRTRAFGSPFRSFSFSLGLNDAVTFRDVLLAPVAGAEWLGFASGRRSLPDALQRGAGNLSDAQQSAALSQFRNHWSAQPGTASPNLSFSGSTGSRFDLAGRDVRLLGALSYQRRTEAQLDETRATPGMHGSETVPLNEFTATTGRRSVLWGGILNFSSELGDGTRLHFNNTYDRTADNEALHLRGFDEELDTDLDVTRLQFVERTILSNQLAASHAWAQHGLDWSATYSRVTRNEPDRSELVYAREQDVATTRPVWAFFGGGAAPSTRAFGELTEQSAALRADYTLTFGADDAPASLRIGTLYRLTDRDSETKSFDFDNVGLSLNQRALPAEEIFGGEFFQPGNLGIRLRPNLFGGTYTAREHLGAGYAMVEYPVTRRLDLVGGARVEAADIDLVALDVLGRNVPAALTNTDVLPAATVNLRLSPEQNLRLSATRTLSRPEYRELANITYRDHVGSFLVFGNPELRRALIDNYDLRWEVYPTGGEVMSVALFGKRFHDPIERVVIPATGAPVLTFRNARHAETYGVELDFRRRLGFLTDALDALTVSTNATLVRSEVDYGGTDAAEAATSQRRPLLGQAPYVFNLSLIYEATNQATATLLFNGVGERITEVGLGGIPDAYEQPRSSLDFAAEYPVLGTARLRLEAENLLDADTEIRQGTVTRLRYRTGRSLSIGVSVEP